MVRKRVVFSIVSIVIIALSLTLVFLPQETARAIDESNTFATISTNFQRKTFFANGYFWLFYCNGSHILYSASPDGQVWSESTVVQEGISSSGLSVWYDGEVHYAYASAVPGDSLVYKKGNINANKIQWSPEQTAVPGVKATTFFFTNQQENGNLWLLSGIRTANSDESTSIMSGKQASGNFFLAQPGQEVRTSTGTSLPTNCTGKGWRTQPLSMLVSEGTWQFSLRLVNLDQEGHSGNICVRIWKSANADLSGAIALTDWVESSKITFSSESPEIEKMMWVPVPNADFKNEFMFVELGWKVESAGSSDSSGVKFQCSVASQIMTTTYEYYNGFCVLDSNGYPWIGYYRNDGYYWEPCVVQANSTDGTAWNSAVKLSEPSVVTRRTCILPLTSGKVYAIYSGIDEIMGRLWNGANWEAEEKIAATNQVQEYGFSAVSYEDRVYLALLENSTSNILFLTRSPSSGWQQQVMQANQDSGSFPILSIDKNQGNVYCFWLYGNTLHMKSYLNGSWEENNKTPFGATFKVPRGISCFYQVWDGKIGIAWIEKPADLFILKYGFVEIQSNMSGSIANTSPNFSLYATSGCAKCKEQIALLEKLFGNGTVTFYDITDSKNVEYYKGITDLLVKSNVLGATDPNKGLIPLVGFFRNGDLHAITFGPLSEKEWEQIAESTTDGNARCFIGSSYVVKALDRQSSTNAANLFSQSTSVTETSTRDNYATLVPLIGLAAAIDAINPCELNAFLILLVYVFYNVGKSNVLKIGLSFASAVFISYYILGLGAIRILQNIPQLKLAVVAFGLAIGILEILAFLGLERKHVPTSFANRIRESLKKAANPYSAFFAGILVSLFLLPCTSGSYFVALDLLSKNATFGVGLGLLAFYNAIVVLPFIAIALGVYTLTFKTAKVRVWLTDKEKYLRFFGGATMIFLSLLLII